ncbi:hypothetical protein N7520_009921 [Penicillium odoratum]|uniref:uncharacterized protein n=1 Tax=Penicillium odoratum TaxID=1167516 RepID=UPI002548499A|nr:uncharacterized protein N7520_009921 [Penicillium odoratum]KAJ5753004.1 hypothetical protein N7520_009921 [Penicillium odoratum]
MSQQPASKDDTLQWAELLYRGALYAFYSGKVLDTTAMALLSMEKRVKLLSVDHELTTESMEMLAIGYGDDGTFS